MSQAVIGKPVMFDNLRFYILSFSVVASLAIVAGLRLLVESDQLYAIRLQQVFGFTSLGFWYVALLISPLGFVIGKQRVGWLIFGRRAIGVSAFYFALLHGLVALTAQLGGISQLGNLPEIFQWSLAFGTVSFVILLLMALTSFDAVVRWMTFRKWKWLHRLTYLAGILVIIHVWLIGTHLAYDWLQFIAVVLLAVLFGLELYRLSVTWSRQYFKLGRAETVTLFITLWALSVIGLLSLPALAQNYHSSHTLHEAQAGGEL